MEQNQNINLECIKPEQDFINTKYHNICTGEVTVVPTGIFDYMLGIPLALIVIAIAGFAIVSLYRHIRD